MPLQKSGYSSAKFSTYLCFYCICCPWYWEKNFQKGNILMKKYLSQEELIPKHLLLDDIREWRRIISTIINIASPPPAMHITTFNFRELSFSTTKSDIYNNFSFNTSFKRFPNLLSSSFVCFILIWEKKCISHNSETLWRLHFIY